MRKDLIIAHAKKHHDKPLKSLFFKEKFDLKKALDLGIKDSPEKALEYIKNKSGNLIPSFNWDDWSKEQHDQAFTVAKSTCADVLQDIFNAVEKMKKEGISFEQFKKDLEPILKEKGWWGKKVVVGPDGSQKEVQLGSENRLKIIYHTNQKMAYAKGKLEQQLLTKKQFPYWQYKQIQRDTKDKEHAKYHNLVFRADDPIWSKIYPPSRFGCGCSVVQLSEKDLQKKGLKVTDGGDIEVNPDSHNISPFDKWAPDGKNLHDKIKQQMLALLKKKPEEKNKAQEKPKVILHKEFSSKEWEDFKDGFILPDEIVRQNNYYDTQFQKQRDDFLKSLKAKSKDAARALDKYTGHFSKDINNELRETGTNDDYELLKKHDFDLILQEDVVVYHGKKFYDKYGSPDIPDNILNIGKSAFYYENAMLSTSLNKEIPTERFAKLSTDDRHSFVFIIKLKKGTRFTFGTIFEKELILDFDKPFTVNKVDDYTKPGGKILKIIEMELL